ncbi:MAG: hypothetical protein WDN26_03075 [Chitinophagaceae bacterium]
MRLLLLILACAFSTFSFSQSITGIWRGYFISESGDQYKLEFQVKQGASFAVSGVSYSYLDIRFYGKATMTGNFVKTSKNFRIREIRTVEVKNVGGSSTCIMNYDLEYSTSGKEEFLEGTYLGRPEVKGKENPYDWGDCGGGKVFLRKVTTSSFYVEPFLRNNLVKTKPTSTPPPVVKKQPITTNPNTIVPKTNTATTKPVTKTTNTTTRTNTTINNKPLVIKSKIDSVTKIQKEDIAKLPPVARPPVLPAPDVIKNRQNELMKSLTISSPDVTVKLYDNGEIDGDTISVYLDNKLVLSQKRLSTVPLIVKLKMDDINPGHELVMVAENLGRIPPNTSLMIVEAGEKRFEVRITSTEQKNAVVRFRYQKPD